MKQLQLDLKQRLLIVEYATEAEIAIEWALMTAFKNATVNKARFTLKPICKGSDLTEEIAHDIAIKIPGCKMTYYLHGEQHDGNITGSAIESFTSAIEAASWHWGNPLGDQPHNTGLTGQYPTGHSLMDLSLKKALDWMDAESRTFHPERCIIFKITS